MIVDKFLLWAALIVGSLTYSLWSVIRESFNIPVFYIGNSFFVFLLCLFLFKVNRKSLVCFLLLCVTLNNVLDELFFSPTEIQLNEIVLLILMPLLWYIKTKRYAGKNT